MEALEALSVGYLIGGKLYPEIVEQADEALPGSWFPVHDGNRVWHVLDMADCRRT
jgi:hypothetical protein